MAEERRPQTDGDWLILRQHALTVAEAGYLLLIEDRSIAATNAITARWRCRIEPGGEVEQACDNAIVNFGIRAIPDPNSAMLGVGLIILAEA